MEPIRINPYYINLFWAIVGLLLGLIPLIKGSKRGKTKLGILALVCTTVGGAVLGIFLIIPVLAIFLWLILKKDGSNEGAPQEDPLQVNEASDIRSDTGSN